MDPTRPSAVRVLIPSWKKVPNNAPIGGERARRFPAGKREISVRGPNTRPGAKGYGSYAI
jgi:hypothetical protein